MKFIKVTDTEFAGYNGVGEKVWERSKVLLNPASITFVKSYKDDDFPLANTFIGCADMEQFHVTESLEEVMMEIDRCNSDLRTTRGVQ